MPAILNPFSRLIVRDALANQARSERKSMQEYLLGELERRLEGGEGPGDAWVPFDAIPLPFAGTLETADERTLPKARDRAKVVDEIDLNRQAVVRREALTGDRIVVEVEGAEHGRDLDGGPRGRLRQVRTARLGHDHQRLGIANVGQVTDEAETFNKFNGRFLTAFDAKPHEGALAVRQIFVLEAIGR